MGVDDDFMTEVGLGAMPEPERQEFMKQAQEELEMRVGEALGAKLNDEQLDEFNQMEDANVALSWLGAVVPNYRDLVMSAVEQFKNELKASSQEILA